MVIFSIDIPTRRRIHRKVSFQFVLLKSTWMSGDLGDKREAIYIPGRRRLSSQGVDLWGSRVGFFETVPHQLQGFKRGFFFPIPNGIKQIFPVNQVEQSVFRQKLRVSEGIPQIGSGGNQEKESDLDSGIHAT